MQDALPALALNSETLKPAIRNDTPPNAAVNGYRNVSDTLLSIVLFFAEYGPVLTFWLLVLAAPAWLIRRRWRHATATI